MEVCLSLPSGMFPQGGCGGCGVFWGGKAGRKGCPPLSPSSPVGACALSVSLGLRCARLSDLVNMLEKESKRPCLSLQPHTALHPHSLRPSPPKWTKQLVPRGCRPQVASHRASCGFPVSRLQGVLLSSLDSCLCPRCHHLALPGPLSILSPLPGLRGQWHQGCAEKISTNI